MSASAERVRAATVRVEPPEPAAVAPPEKAAGARPIVAVLVAHGMGQQVRFETLQVVVEALQRGAERHHARLDPVVRMAPLAGEVVPRVDLRVGDRDVHVYEAYWAPIPEGRVGLRDVLAFLLSAGIDGSRAAWGGPGFERLLFGRWRAFRIGRSTAVGYTLALAALASMFLLDAVVLIAAAIASAATGRFVPIDPARLVLFKRDIALFGFSFLQVVAGVGLGWTGTRRGLMHPGRLSGALAGSGMLFVQLGLWLLVAAGALAAWDLSPFVHLPAAGDPLMALFQVRLRWIAAACVAGLGAYAVVRALARFRRLYGAITAALLVLAEAAGIAIFTTVIWTKLSGTAAPDVLARVAPLLIALCWALAVLSVPVGRWFLIEYVGDVAAYISAHKVSRFDEVRKAIQKVAADLAHAVYGAEGAEGFVYDEVVWVGHSLGSVIAYDTINTLLNEDLALARQLRVAERTPTFLTLGSPLDKTAFLFRSQRPDPHDVREGLAAARQPLIVDYAFRPDRWINLHASGDWIGGALQYYDLAPGPGATPGEVARWRRRRVRNRRDPRALTPLAAHNELFEGVLFGSTLYRLLER